MNLFKENVFAAIFRRRSIRKFHKDQEVEHEKIISLLEAAMAAPSACNIQPWEFVVVTEKSAVSSIKKSITRWGDYNAPLIIVVCSYTDYIPWEGTGIEDCSAAIENMLIAATAMDLGSVWIGGFDPESVRKILDIPDAVHVVGVIYFGYPAEQQPPRTKYLDAAVHWQRYDREREHPPRPGNILTPESK